MSTKQPVVHTVDCWDAVRREVPAVDVRVASDAWAVYHGCMARYTEDMPTVRFEWVDIPEHAYQPSMIWLRGESRPRCTECRQNDNHRKEVYK